MTGFVENAVPLVATWLLLWVPFWMVRRRRT